MRKLVRTMLKYEKETSFNHQANMLLNTAYKPNKDYINMEAGDGYQSKTLAVANKQNMKQSRENSAHSHAKSEHNLNDSNLSFAYNHTARVKTGKRENER